MTPYLSVVVPTNRVGGLNFLFGGLLQQTFRDFELVLSDGLYRHRREIVRENSRLFGFPVTHVEPIDNPFPLSAFCRYANTGLAHARGEVVVFLVDYTRIPPNCLQTHAKFHRMHANQGLMCPHDYVTLDPPEAPFPYAQGEVDRYVADIDAGTLNGRMWALGVLGSEGPDPVYKGADPKLRLPAGPISPAYFHAKNESVPMAALEAINGWAEEFDGGHPYQDTDIAVRLSAKAGIRWTLEPSCVARIINPRPYFPFPRRLRTPEENMAILKRRDAAGYPDTNTWNLKERRAQYIST